MVAKRLVHHLNTHRLFYNHQFSYYTGHSTKTQLLNVRHDIAEALDNKRITTLDLSDVSAALKASWIVFWSDKKDKEENFWLSSWAI